MSSVFWEDDPIQLEDNEYKGGANRVSLIQARHNFLLFGACEEEMKKHVRNLKKMNCVVLISNVHFSVIIERRI